MTVIVLGPSLGTTGPTLWSGVATRLLDAPAGAPQLEPMAWDLPGHGGERRPVPAELTMADLARRVLDDLDERGVDRFHYAGDSVGGAVGLQLLLDAPERVLSATLLCTGARIGTAASWQERAAQVRASGTPSLVAASAARWFVPGFVERQPDAASALLHALSDADDAGYAAVCHALEHFDVRERLAEIAAPVLAVAGAHDVATPPDSLREIAEGVQAGRLVVLDDVAHLAPAEAPEQVARLIRDHVASATDAGERALR
ncbi:alpha/beta fold hydrolase [Nocardioides sp.]|uniref:alpha/beta fold hydrolase n=1 Tax=Nocardioides sp. TaxID=35761 RepID=UPI0035122AF4